MPLLKWGTRCSRSAPMTSVALLFRMVMVFSVRGAMRYGEGSACNSSLKGDGRIEFFLGMLQRDRKSVV